MTAAVEQSRQVHDFLLSPHAYPESTKHVEVKETHISWIYLTDRHVYKQKKPVTFEFLDFSTLQKRKHFCEQEVELNRRMSPDVYLGVVPVSRQNDDHYQLKSGDNIVEWLVKMTRLDDACTLESYIQTETLTSEQVQRLSRHLTSFYSAQAPVMLRSGDFLQNLHRHVMANRNDLLISLPKSEALVRYLTNAQLRCTALASECFVQRVADGRVVDGHGDLRPEHVYFRRGKPVVIDCIEFNAEYRQNDVIDDLAFLAMECDRLGNQLVGESILTTYQANSSDDCPNFLTAFYKCYRACVRAKVAALRATQSSGELQVQLRELAREYLQLAKSYSAEFSPRLVITVGGLSGTGKSTVARAIHDTFSAELLQTDLIRQELFDPGRNGKYSQAGRERVYKEMFARIPSCLESSPTVILDGTFPTRQLRQIAADLAKAQGARFLQIQCECPAQIAESRIVERQNLGLDASEADPQVLANQRKCYEDPLKSEPLLNVDTTQDMVDQAHVIASFLRSSTENCYVH